MWRHTWRENWVNCAVLTGNNAGLRTVLSSRLSHRELRSSVTESPHTRAHAHTHTHTHTNKHTYTHTQKQTHIHKHTHTHTHKHTHTQTHTHTHTHGSQRRSWSTAHSVSLVTSSWTQQCVQTDHLSYCTCGSVAGRRCSQLAISRLVFRKFPVRVLDQQRRYFGIFLPCLYAGGPKVNVQLTLFFCTFHWPANWVWGTLYIRNGIPPYISLRPLFAHAV